MSEASAGTAELVVERRGRAGWITLNRPAALNALTHAMIRDLDALLRGWARDPAIGQVVITGAGDRAFCAGGDVKALYDARDAPDRRLHRDFYFDEYRLNCRIARFPKPYVALVDGFVMGGGAGVSIHGGFRVATEKAKFAMPETGIGLFPDIGASYFLPRCPGRTGLYLGLTGVRIGAADMRYAGLATHIVARERMPELGERLSRMDAGEALSGLAEAPGSAELPILRPVIDRCFAGEQMVEIMAALAREGTPWADETARVLRRRSPLALAVACRLYALGRDASLEDCLQREATAVQHFMAGHDFFEGVRALLIDRDQAPRWRPERIEDVREADVDACLSSSGVDALTFTD